MLLSDRMEYIKITKDNVKTVLELFNKDIDNEGFIIDRKTGKKIECPYSKKPIRYEDFSILPGSIFVNNEIYSFARYRIAYSDLDK